MKRSRLGILIVLVTLGVPLLVILGIASTLITFTDNWNRPTDFAAQHLELMRPTYGPDEQVPTEPPSFDELYQAYDERVNLYYARQAEDKPPCSDVDVCFDEIIMYVEMGRRDSHGIGLPMASGISRFSLKSMSIASDLLWRTELTAEQSRQLKVLIRQIPVPELDRVIESERLLQLDRLRTSMSPSIFKRSDVRTQMAKMDAMYAKARDRSKLPIPARFADVESPDTWGKLDQWKFRGAIANWTGYDRFARDEAYGKAMKTGFIAGIAVREYRRDRGELPTRLAELVPDYIDAVPVDPFTESDELRYRRTDGPAGFVVYSVGLDGTDNGGDDRGDPVGAASPNGKGLDLVVFPWPKRETVAK